MVAALPGDGAIDVVLNNLSSQGQQLNVQAFVNHAGAGENWVRFHVVGHAGNRAAIGSSVQVTAGGNTQGRELYAGDNNYKSQNELVYHFGLGDALHAEKIHVTWPGGELSRTLQNYPANHTWTLYPPEMLEESCRIAERCRFSLDELRYEYPEELVPPHLSSSEYLRQLTYAGAAERIGYEVSEVDQTIESVTADAATAEVTEELSSGDRVEREFRELEKGGGAEERADQLDHPPPGGEVVGTERTESIGHGIEEVRPVVGTQPGVDRFGDLLGD